MITIKELGIILNADRQVVEILLREAYSRAKAERVLNMHDDGHTIEEIHQELTYGNARIKLSAEDKELILRTLKHSTNKTADVKTLALRFGVTRVYINYLLRESKRWRT